MMAVLGNAQEIVITGQVLEYRDRKGLQGVLVSLEGDDGQVMTDRLGNFRLTTTAKGPQTLLISAPQYQTMTFPLMIGKEPVALGPVFMKRDLEIEKTDNLITLTEFDLIDEAGSSSNSGFLQATRDVFLNRAAFDFGQAFFRVRGYDSREGKVLINGVPMNRNWDDRPQWNNWGGLNDATRDQEFSFGLEASDHAFGGLLGTTLIDTSPLKARPGIRISAAASDRTYRNRLMTTYHTGQGKRGFAHSLSLSRRWAEEGYVHGTPYDAYSIFISSGIALNEEHSIAFTVINAYNSRGRSAALTDEVSELAGPRYNPYWAKQGDTWRSSRMRTLQEPLLMLNYEYARKDFRLRVNTAYQTGGVSYTRIGYFDAPNPDPTYYRYLPSFYRNSPIGANYTGANEAREGFQLRSQWPWADLYEANAAPALEGRAAYAYYEDRNEEDSFTTNTVINLPLGKVIRVDAGMALQYSTIQSFSRVNDLMGATFLLDMDTFSNTRNDLNGKIDKQEGEIFGYHYRIDARSLTSFIQTRFIRKQWDFYVAGEYAEKSFRRDGFFLNERFPNQSFGKGENTQFTYGGIKSALSYGISSRHWIKAHIYNGRRPPLLKHLFVNPRESNQVVPGIEEETVFSADVNYHLRLPGLKGRASAYYSRFQHGTEVNFFYVDSGFGSDFVQEVVTGLDRLHKGVEIGLEYQVSPTTRTSLVASVGSFTYASDPDISINFDTSDAEGEMRQTNGSIDLGTALIKGYKLPQGPQTALSIGIEYRDPDYWWIGATANYLADNHIDIAFIKRTPSFKIDPLTGRQFESIEEGDLRTMLNQDPIPPVYLLNLTGGKSWLHKGKYISAFLSVNNLFDVVYKSGGYEQSRNGNYGQMYRDHLSGSPSFGPKYWYGFGRTFFLNLAISF
ncbi:TonB-dependent receptor [Muriicola jejuensis]|uniref:TonB-dependent receptor n=1 Tax=Muriicola jejuensis TaxID=504488 RepID=A0A6P0UE78_9FLAO|nr:TonB-dependent receptor [Muriicola jejuensis]NER10199.1 TonB-dependent receptor [Muriicola jejuensis]